MRLALTSRDRRSLDGVYDCRKNRKAIFNRGMVPNINANPRGRKAPSEAAKPLFDPAIFKERFNTIERVFGWEDKFRRLLLRFERISQLALCLQNSRIHDDQPAALLPGLISKLLRINKGRLRPDSARPVNSTMKVTPQNLRELHH